MIPTDKRTPLNDAGVLERLVAVSGTASDMDPRGHRERRLIAAAERAAAGDTACLLDLDDRFLSGQPAEAGAWSIRRERRRVDDPRYARRRGNWRASVLSLGVALTPQESIMEQMMLESPLDANHLVDRRRA